MSKKNRKQKQMEREIRRNKQFQYNQEKKGENIQRVKQNSTLVHSKNMEKWIENEYEKGETAWCPWDDAPTILTPPSKEKLETFLKEVGGRSPFYYKNSSDRELMKQK